MNFAISQCWAFAESTFSVTHCCLWYFTQKIIWTCKEKKLLVKQESVINERRRLKGPSTPRTRTTAIILNTSFLRVKPKRSETNSLVPEKLKWHRQALLALKLSEVTFGWFARDLEAAAASFLGDVHSEIVIFLFKIFHLCRVPLNWLGPSDIHTYISASKQIFQALPLFKQTL